MNQLRRRGTDSPLRRLLAVRDLGFRRPVLTGALLALAVLILYGSLIDLVNDDINLLFSVWLDYMQTNGYWTALKDPFHNYSGPYLYILTLSTVALDGFLSDLHIIKFTSIFGVIGLACVVYFYARRYADPRFSPIVAAGMFMLVPSVAMNAAAWGQSDIFYTGLLAVSLVFALRKQIVLMIVFFGIALSFKLQAVFWGPFIVFMMLRHRANLAMLALLPLIYVVANCGLLLAGRPLESVMLIYVDQAEAFKVLSAHAPNPWWLLEKGIRSVSGRFYGDDSIHIAGYYSLVMVGLVIAAIVGLRISLLGLRSSPLSDYDVAAIATLTATIMPYVLPKMHDRYFFVAVVFSYLLFLMRPSLWPIFVCIEIGSALAHLVYLSDASSLTTTVALTVALVALSAGLLLLLSRVATAFAPRGAGRWQRFVQAYGVVPRGSA